IGTHNLICVFYNGQFVLAQYGSCDGYPKGQGLEIVKFLKNPGNIQRLKDGLNHTFKVSDEVAYVAKRQINNLRGLERLAWDAFIKLKNPLVTIEVIRHLRPSLHGSTGAGILKIVAQAWELQKVPIKFDLSFAADWVYCKWAYVIDLDGEVLEVFRGSTQKTPDHRLKDVGEDSDSVPALISSFSFSELEEMKGGNGFLKRVNDSLYEEIM
ncbi:hypothetical protein B0T25DRAFT_617503, partial [Lasiosphaeria hispida]